MRLSAIEADFLISALVTERTAVSMRQFDDWFAERRKRSYTIEKIPLDEITGWRFEAGTGNLVHHSDRFFKIQGISVETNFGPIPRWSQPIIFQPEVGILGIIAKKIDGVLHFLLQAKMEPGNIEQVQLAPTVQATKSNFTRVHGGRTTRFLEYFQERNRYRILSDQLQSEQGGRFYHKRNRNVIVEVASTELSDPGEDFCWLTLGQLHALLERENVVNMDARTVLSCIHYHDHSSAPPDVAELAQLLEPLAALGLAAKAPKLELLLSELAVHGGYRDFVEIRSWFTQLKMEYELNVTPIPLNAVEKWTRDRYTYHHEQRRFFSVIGVRVRAEEREVVEWCQPLVEQVDGGIAGFLIKTINGIPHLLVQAKVEPGNFDVLEMAPTVQCITSSYGPNDGRPYLDLFLSPPPSSVLYDRLQSEEGGRFYREANRYMLVQAPADFPVENLDPRYFWMTVGQAAELIKYNNYFNVEARSLIACLDLY